MGVRSLLVVAGVTLLGGGFVAPAVVAQPGVAPASQPVDAETQRRIEAVGAKAAGVKDLRARFTQLKHTALLAEPVETKGEVRAAEGVVLWRAEGAEAVRTQVKGGRLRIYYVKRNVVEDYPAGGRLGELAASPLPRLETLHALFTMRKDSGEGLPVGVGAGHLCLRLEPREGEMKQYLDHVRVLLDEGRGTVDVFELTDPDGETTTIRFEDVRLNSGMKGEELELGVRGDTKMLKPIEPGKADEGGK